MPHITQSEIEQEIKQLGLGTGDIVLLHSSLSSLGKVEGGAETVVEAFLHVIGSGGTLVVPIFGALGIITQVVRAHPKAIKSVHPVAAVAAIGSKAEEICADHWKAELAHAEETPYTRIAALGGYVLLLGVDQDRNTTLHTVEELLRLPYLKETGDRTFETPEGEVTKSWPFFPGPHRDFIGIDAALRESGAMKTGRIGTSVARLIRSSDLINIASRIGREDPAFVLCDNPNCADCVGQRADLRRDQLNRESFTLLASTLLAGTYPEEIADRSLAAGIDAVEIDCLYGRPWNMLPEAKLDFAVDTMRRAGISVASLRLQASDTDPGPLCDVATSIGIPRLLVPLGPSAESYLQVAKERNIRISFTHSALSARMVSEQLLKLRTSGYDFGFTFSADEFARAGEHPFLGSYKQKLRRFVDQLDIVDATFDGTPQRLAHGNGEIKELISILRCSSFTGNMVLSAGNRYVGTVKEASDRFMELLDTM